MKPTESFNRILQFLIKKQYFSGDMLNPIFQQCETFYDV